MSSNPYLQVKTGENFMENGNNSNVVELLKWNSSGEQKMSVADDKNSNGVEIVDGKTDDDDEEEVVVTDDEDEGDACVVFRMLEFVRNALWTYR